MMLIFRCKQGYVVERRFSECAGGIFLYLEAMQTEKADLYIVHGLLE